jgi:pyruvate dehydrogenase complex dehydrogenase (E1) component
MVIMAQTRLENPLTDGFIGEMKEMDEQQMAIRIAKVEDSDEEFYIVQVNPWQLWEVKNKKGKVIKELEGNRFTSDRLAQVALDKYLNDRAAKRAKEEQEKAALRAEAQAKYDAMRALEAANEVKAAQINEAKEISVEPKAKKKK